MLTELKHEFIVFMALGECAAHGSECPALLVPSLKGAKVLPLTGSADCLMALINRNFKITPKLLMSQYSLWIGKLAKNPDANLALLDAPLLNAVHQYLAHQMSVAFFAPNELQIDSSGLTRIGPLSFYLSRYRAMFDKNPPAMYTLIHSLSALTVGHRRASVAAGIYLSICSTLIDLRIKLKKPLTATLIKKSIRTVITKALIYYNSTYEYRGETGHYALLQLNKDGLMHLEGVPFEQLHQSNYAVDVLLTSIWFLINITSPSMLLTKVRQLGAPQVGLIAASMFGLAYGETKLKATDKKRFKEVLESLNN